ncbi:trypsin-like peptidase domain-containing protein [Lentisphaerota bacterium WC36G]|nr:trypsin-like peptidase domain-containing protein [Lentisphaerae bacterium WC36]
MKFSMNIMPIFALSSTIVLSGGCAVKQANDNGNSNNAKSSSLYSSGFQHKIITAKNKVFPAVVYIRGVQENLEYGKTTANTVIGSGVIIKETGEVLTNWHVVNKMKNIRCQLQNGKGYNATLIGEDKDTDIALLQLKLTEGEKLEHVAKIRTDDNIKEGDFVMAMGAPWGLNRSVSIGIISCANRYLSKNSNYSLWYQTDASISPGNSGGPLVDSQGRVIGINTLGISSGGNIGFTIPSTTILKIIPRIRKWGKVNWAWTGIQLQPLHDFNLDIDFDYDNGVMISSVEPNSPAFEVGLKARDRIVKINNTDVTANTLEDIPALNSMLGLAPFDQEMTVIIVRRGSKMTFKFKPREKGASEGKELELKRWNMTVKTINQFDNPELYFHRKKGLFIFGIDSPGNADNSELQEADIITKINGKEIKTLDDMQKIYDEAVKNVKEKSKILITVIRGGLLRQVILDFSRDYDRE